MKFFFRRFKRIRSIDLDDEICRQIFLFKELMILRNYVRTLILRGYWKIWNFSLWWKCIWFSFEVENYFYNNSKTISIMNNFLIWIHRRENKSWNWSFWWRGCKLIEDLPTSSPIWAKSREQPGCYRRYVIYK